MEPPGRSPTPAGSCGPPASAPPSEARASARAQHGRTAGASRAREHVRPLRDLAPAPTAVSPRDGHRPAGRGGATLGSAPLPGTAGAATGSRRCRGPAGALALRPGEFRGRPRSRDASRDPRGVPPPAPEDQEPEDEDQPDPEKRQDEIDCGRNEEEPQVLGALDRTAPTQGHLAPAPGGETRPGLDDGSRILVEELRVFVPRRRRGGEQRAANPAHYFSDHSGPLPDFVRLDFSFLQPR